MANQFRWLEEVNLCLVRYEGTLGLADLQSTDAEIYELTRGENVGFLFDMRSAVLALSATDARTYARWISQLDLPSTHPGMKQVILVDSPHQTGLSMLMADVAEAPFDIVSSIEGAAARLGVRATVLEANRDLIPA